MTIGYSKAELSYTNGIYTVYVDNTSSAPGTFTFQTGPAHPVPNANILFAGGDAWSSYITIRSYSSNTDYVSKGDSLPSTTPGFTVQRLRSFPYVINTLPNGFSVLWNVNTPDVLSVEHTVTIEGTTLTDSIIKQKIKVSNNGSTPVTIGIRLMLDLMILANDDALIKRVPGDPNFINTFFAQPPPPISFDYFEFTDIPNTFSVFGTVQNVPVTPPPTAPTLFYFSSWGSAYSNAWTFSVSGCCVDSAVAYFWGDNSGNAITIGPGQSYEVYQYITTQRTAIPSTTPQPNQPNLSHITSPEFGDLRGIDFRQVQVLTQKGPAIVKIESQTPIFISGIQIREFRSVPTSMSSLRSNIQGGSLTPMQTQEQNFILDLNAGDRPCGTTQFNLAGYCTVGIIFEPKSVGKKEAHLEVYYNTPYPVRMYITGEGVQQSQTQPPPPQPPTQPPSGGSTGGSGASSSSSGGGGCSLSYGVHPLNAIGWLLIPVLVLARRIRKG
jgi:uncharacterized membrane protein YgcG